MTANAESVPKPQAPPKRRLRNFLLDPRFQLKYTGMVVGVTLVVAGVLGWLTYEKSVEVSESLQLQIMDNPILTEDMRAAMLDDAREEDERTLTRIVIGVGVLVLVLGLLGIMVTHKVVGPSYKLRRLIREVGEGQLKLQGRLRKGDELQEVFEAFASMVESLREAQSKEIAQLEEALDRAREAGVPDDALEAIIQVRDRMQATLD